MCFCCCFLVCLFFDVSLTALKLVQGLQSENTITLIVNFHYNHVINFQVIKHDHKNKIYSIKTHQNCIYFVQGDYLIFIYWIWLR